MSSPYTLFWDWCFDKKPDSSIPSPEVLLKYNSPITVPFLLKSFLNNIKLNHYLNTHMNHIGLYSIEKEELYKFIKKCIQDFKIQRREIHYSPYKTRDQLTEKLTKKFPVFKPYDVELLATLVQKDEMRSSIYRALGMDKPQKQKLKKRKKKKKAPLKIFLAEHFRMVTKPAKEFNM